MVAGHLEVKRGIYQCVLNYTDESGKRKRQSISTGLSEKGNKKRAEKILMDLRRTFQPPVDQTARIISGLSSEMMFSDYMLQWLEIVKTRIKPATYSSYCLMVKKTIAPYFAEKSIRLGELEPRHIQQFYSEQLKRVKANTVIHYHANIHSALKYAMKIDLIDVNVADKVDRPKKNDFMPGFYDADEMQELFAALKGHKLELVVLVAAFYGLRRGEVLGLKWDAIDFERNTITIKRTVTSVNIDGKVTILEQDSAKTKSSLRTLPLVSQFREYFLSVKEAQKENKKVCGNSYDYSHDGYVFVDALGRRMKPDYIQIDNRAAPGTYWLTSSQAFKLMELAQESLAGRVAILHMSSLSQHEIYGSGECKPFTLDLTALKARETTNAPADITQIYERIWNSSMPGLVSGKFTGRDVFYASYLQTYIDRDVKEQVQLADPLQFRDFVRAAACRAGQMLNVHDIARDVGVSDDTAKRWLQVLEKSDVIFFLRPYSNNLLKRTVKTPKMYFFDTGLVAYLTRYSSPEILANGAMNGAILENYVVGELLKSYHNNAKECLLWYYRDSNCNEIDMVIESDGMLHPLEIKRSVNPNNELIGAFTHLDKASVPRGSGAILCMRPKLSAINSENFIVPIWMI